MHFDWIENGVLAASPLPSSAEDVAALREKGVRAIVTLTERPLTSDRNGMTPELLDSLDVLTLHVPIDDLRSPNDAQAAEVVEFIDRMQAEGRATLIHCKVGQGRTGTLLHAYYLSKGYSLTDAKYQVSLRRPLCDFVNLSDEQKQFLERFAAGRIAYL